LGDKTDAQLGRQQKEKDKQPARGEGGGRVARGRFENRKIGGFWVGPLWGEMRRKAGRERPRADGQKRGGRNCSKRLKLLEQPGRTQAEKRSLRGACKSKG